MQRNQQMDYLVDITLSFDAFSFWFKRPRPPFRGDNARSRQYRSLANLPAGAAHRTVVSSLSAL